MNLISSTRTASAALLMAAAALIANPASAQRGIDIDNPDSPPLDVCTLGQQCNGNDLSIIDATFYGPTSVGGTTVTYFGNQRIFIYNEGVVCFDNQLPIGSVAASVAGGLASLGSGNWFAPGLSNTTAYAFNDAAGKIRVQWGASLDNLDFSFAIQGNFTVTPFVQFGYAGGPPAIPPGVVTGYNYTPFSGVISVGNPNGGGNAPYDASLAGFDLRYAGSSLNPTTVVPEPGTWALLILGFGLAGAALRRRESVLTQA